MAHKLTNKLKEAFKRYYRNRNRMRNKEEGFKWNKDADLDNIFNSLPAKCVYIQASAGTFWLTWKHPKIQTMHKESNWWTMKVLARYDKKTKKWIRQTEDWS
jgi:hypothetical protein